MDDHFWSAEELEVEAKDLEEANSQSSHSHIVIRILVLNTDNIGSRQSINDLVSIEEHIRSNITLPNLQKFRKKVLFNAGEEIPLSYATQQWCDEYDLEMVRSLKHISNNRTYLLFFYFGNTQISEATQANIDVILYPFDTDDSVNPLQQSNIWHFDDEYSQCVLPYFYLTSMHSVDYISPARGRRNEMNNAIVDTVVTENAMDGWLEVDCDDHNSAQLLFERIVSKVETYKHELPDWNDDIRVEKSICIDGWGSIAYDIAVMLITVIDIFTDVWVIHRYHKNERTTFYELALFFLILAQLCYVAGFVYRFVPTHKLSVTVIACILVCAPLLPIAMYWGVNENSFIARQMSEYDLEIQITDEPHITTKPKPKLRQWIDSKFHKHVGFILEGLMESLPQAIIQLGAIAYYQEDNWVEIASILVSLLSVLSKSFLISAAINTKTYIFNLLSIVLDILGLFMIISFVFYNPDNPGILTDFGVFWLWKYYVTTIPTAFWYGIALTRLLPRLKFIDDWLESSADKPVQLTVVYIFLFITVAISAILAVIFASIVLEICCFSYIAVVLFVVNGNRFNTASIYGAQFWWHTFDFVRNGSDKRDTILRLCSVNRMISQSALYSDPQLSDFLYRNEATLYRNVEMSDFRSETDAGKNGSIKGELCDAWLTYYRKATADFEYYRYNRYNYRSFFGLIAYYVWAVIGTFLLIPVYVIQRIMKVCYPIAFVVTMKGSKMSFFHWLLMCIYGLMLFVWIGLAPTVLREQYLTYHIQTGAPYFSDNTVKRDRYFARLLQTISEYYRHIISEPVRHNTILQCLGDDIGNIVINFLPKSSSD